MARIDRKRLDAARFAVSLDVPTRFDDVDMQGHVNNAAAVVILQEARANFNLAAGLRDHLGGLRTMVAALAVEYAGETYHPGIVTVSTGVLAVGRTSFTLGQVARQNGRSTLYAQAVMVIADAKGAVPIPDVLRAAYGRFLIPEV
jgi:acyl-CoA thioester hydrolase